MKPLLKLINLLLMSLLFLACSGSDKNTSASWFGETEISENKEYAIEDFGLSIGWTTYKFSDRVGVSGTFDDFTFTKENESGSIEDVLKGLKLAIPTDSVESENGIPDFKLCAYFFRTFNIGTITGKVLDANDGEGIITFEMNNISIDTPFTYILENGKIVLFTHLNLKKWNGKEALATRNNECYELHKGNDDVSKLRSDVDVVVELAVNRTVH